MKNNQYPTNISPELQDTLRQDESIKTVYFDKNGKHFFNVHELLIKKDSKEKKLFTRGVHSHSQVIPGAWNVEKIKERISVGVTGCEVVNTMDRDEVLNYNNKPKKASEAPVSENTKAEKEDKKPNLKP